MPFVPVANVAQVEYVFTSAGQVWENVLHYATNGSLDEPALANLAAEMITLWQTHLRPGQMTGTTLLEVKCTDLTTESGATAAEIPVTNNSGTTNGDLLPNNCALVVTLQTGKRGRSNRGRIYFAGFGEPECVGSTWGADALNPVQAFMSAIRNVTVEGQDWGLVVVSRQHNFIKLETGMINEVVSFRVNSTVASQRRRLPGRGR